MEGLIIINKYIEKITYYDNLINHMTGEISLDECGQEAGDVTNDGEYSGR